MTVYYDRYQQFKTNGEVKTLPFVKIPAKDTDKKVVYNKAVTRFDKLSQTYYGNPYHGYLILLANPQYGGLEFNIPNNAVIRIPFPFNQTLQQYQEQLNRFEKLYGINE